MPKMNANLLICLASELQNILMGLDEVWYGMRLPQLFCRPLEMYQEFKHLDTTLTIILFSWGIQERFPFWYWHAACHLVSLTEI
jgi:hypothetical protein